MIRLETVEDFEKILSNLEDLSSKPRYYCVCPYSYCSYCNEVKEFEAPVPVGRGDIITVMCLGCSKFFTIEDLKDKDNIDWGDVFILDNQSSTSHLAEMKRLNSREMQTKFFAVELERRITKEKSELRKTQDRIHKFARLRS